MNTFAVELNNLPTYHSCMLFQFTEVVNRICTVMSISPLDPGGPKRITRTDQDKEL
jgi:hypothetical protein